MFLSFPAILQLEGKKKQNIREYTITNEVDISLNKESEGLAMITKIHLEDPRLTKIRQHIQKG